MTYNVTFTSGDTAPVTVRGQCGAYLIGLARRADGYMRAVFIDNEGRCEPDPWVQRVEPVEVVVARGNGA